MLPARRALFLVLLFALLPLTVQAQTIVDDDGTGDYTSIQAAINNASPGDIIEVLEGTYAEDVEVNEVVSLKGPNVGTPGDGSRGNEATIEGQVVISASDVVFDGFDVSPPPATSNATGEALRIGSGSNGPDNVIVRNNIVRDFEENGLNEGLDGINVFGGNGNDVLDSPNIANNLVENLDRPNSAGGAAGISIQGNVENADVEGNTVRNITDTNLNFAFGIVVRGSGNTTENPENINVENNKVLNITDTDPYSGVGFGLEDRDGGGFMNVANNDIKNTDFQVEDKTNSLDLSTLIQNNTFDPVVLSSSISVNRRIIFGKIQKAVDLSTSGATIDVRAGTFEEQVVVSKDNLTLSGDGNGSDPSSNTIIKSPTSLSYSFTTGSNDNFPIVGVDGATGVTIKNLRVDGAGRGNNNFRFAGIAFWNAGGTVQNSYITGIRETPFSGNQHGAGIFASNNTSSSYSLTVSKSTINDFQKNGMALSGSGLTVEVDNNTVTGKGSISTTALNGIQVGNGATGSITNNTIDDIAYDGPTFASGAILTLFASGTLTVENNTISGSQVSLWFFNNSAMITGNDVSNPATVGVGSWAAILDPDGSDDLPAFSPLDTGSSKSKSVRAKSSTITFSFEDNTLEGTDASGSTGVEVFSSGETLSATLTKNLVKDFDTGIFVGEDSQDLVQSVTVEENCIVSNESAGLTNDAALTVEATGNYWGDNSGPSGDFVGSGDAVFGDVTVDFSPTKVSACPAGDPDPTNCEATTLSEEVDPPENGNPGVVTATFSNLDDIQQIEFTKLENFAVTDSPDNFGQSGDIWAWDGTGDATEAVFELTQQTIGETSTYFAIASSTCDAEADDQLEVNFDPIHELSPEAPAELTFSGNYPNPFRGQTTVEFALPERADVTLSVYDMMGRKVATLVDGAVGAGTHQVRWGGQGSGGQRLSSGVYLMRLEVGDQTRTDRLTIVR